MLKVQLPLGLSHTMTPPDTHELPGPGLKLQSPSLGQYWFKQSQRPPCRVRTWFFEGYFTYNDGAVDGLAEVVAVDQVDTLGALGEHVGVVGRGGDLGHGARRRGGHGGAGEEGGESELSETHFGAGVPTRGDLLQRVSKGLAGQVLELFAAGCWLLAEERGKEGPLAGRGR